MAGFEGEIGEFQDEGLEEEEEAAAVVVVLLALFNPPNCPRSPNGS